MSSLILKKGKFFKDGVEVPVEIGNAEQIAVYKRSLKENSYDMVNSEYIDYDYTIYYEYRIKCECGKYIYGKGSLYPALTYSYNVEHSIKKDIYNRLKNKYVICNKCNKKYEIFADKDDDIFADYLDGECSKCREIIVDYEIEYDYYFKCPYCGKHIKHINEEIDSFNIKSTPENDIENDILRNEYDYCPYCRKECRIIEDEWGTILAVKPLEDSGEDVSIVDVILGGREIE